MADSGSLSYNALVIHGSVAKAREYGFSDAVGSGYTSHDGDPPLCMHLEINYSLSDSGVVTATIPSGRAWLRETRGAWFGHQFKLYLNLLIGDKDLPQYVPTAAEITAGTYASGEAGVWEKFLATCPASNKSSVEILEKPSDMETWENYTRQTQSALTLTRNMGTGPYAYVIVSNYSECSCEQAYKNVPVYLAPLSLPVPPQPTTHEFRINLNGGYRGTSSDLIQMDIVVTKNSGTAINVSFNNGIVTVVNGSSTTTYQIFKTGNSFVGFNTSSSATTGSASISYTTEADVIYYVIWTGQTFVVTFKDGYHPEGQNVIEIVRGIPYGGTIRSGEYTKNGANFQGEIPVLNQNYGNVTFVKKPGLYGLVGWTGGFSLSTRVYSNMTISAVWDFSPIWVKNSSGNWVPYKPVEN